MLSEVIDPRVRQGVPWSSSRTAIPLSAASSTLQLFSPSSSPSSSSHPPKRRKPLYQSRSSRRCAVFQRDDPNGSTRVAFGRRVCCLRAKRLTGRKGLVAQGSALSHGGKVDRWIGREKSKSGGQSRQSRWMLRASSWERARAPRVY